MFRALKRPHLHTHRETWRLIQGNAVAQIRPISPLGGTLTSGNIDEMKRDLKFKLSPKLGQKPTAKDNWVYNLNIGNVMHLIPLALENLTITPQIAHEICKDAIYEKIIMTAIGYFSIATECRFLQEEGNETYLSDSKFWHKAAVELSCIFLPNECPLVGHIVLSYEKHNSLAQEVIVIIYIIYRKKIPQEKKKILPRRKARKKRKSHFARKNNNH